MAMATTTVSISVASACRTIIYAADRMVLYMAYRMIYLTVLRMHRVILDYIVALLPAVTYEWLVMMPLVHNILVMIHLVSQPWIRVVDHYLIAMVEVIPCKRRR